MITNERIANLFNKGMNPREILKYMQVEVPFNDRGELWVKIDNECQRQFYKSNRGHMSGAVYN